MLFSHFTSLLPKLGSGFASPCHPELVSGSHGSLFCEMLNQVQHDICSLSFTFYGFTVFNFAFWNMQFAMRLGVTSRLESQHPDRSLHRLRSRYIPRYRPRPQKSIPAGWSLPPTGSVPSGKRSYRARNPYIALCQSQSWPSFTSYSLRFEVWGWRQNQLPKTSNL